MEVIRRGRALINSRNQALPEVLQVSSLESGDSTPVIVLSSDRCFEPIDHNCPQENDADASTDHPKGDTHVEIYVRLLSALGIIPYNCFGDGRNKKILAVLRKATFGIFAFLCITQGLENLKFFVFRFARKKDLESYVDLGFFLIHGIGRIYFVKFLVFNQDQMLAFLKTLSQRPWKNKDVDKSRMKMLAGVAVLSLVSLMFAILLTLFDIYTWKEWSMKNFILFRSFQITESFYIWSSENYENATTVIDDKFGMNITIATVSLGVACTAMNFSGNLQDSVIQDLTLLVVVTIYMESQKVADPIRKWNKDKTRNAAYADLEEDWRNCGYLHDISDSANEAFGKTLKLMHIKYLFTFTSILLGWLKNDVINTRDLVIALNACKSVLFYYIALKVFENGRACLRWAKRLSRIHKTVQTNGELVKTSILVDEIEADPIGVGAGMFLINDAFMFTMFGTIASVFMIFAQQRESSCNCK